MTLEKERPRGKVRVSSGSPMFLARCFSFPHVQDELQQENVQQDPDLMEDVLNRLANWQEDAERMHVYDMDAKIQRIMDVMGFMSRLVDIYNDE